MELVLAVGGNTRARHALDIAQIGQFLGTAERKRLAFGTGTRGAADAMHVTLGLVGQVVIDDVADIVDVDAACGNVSRDQGTHLAVTEAFQRTLARRLGLVAVNGIR